MIASKSDKYFNVFDENKRFRIQAISFNPSVISLPNFKPMDCRTPVTGVEEVYCPTDANFLVIFAKGCVIHLFSLVSYTVFFTYTPPNPVDRYTTFLENRQHYYIFTASKNKVTALLIEKRPEDRNYGIYPFSNSYVKKGSVVVHLAASNSFLAVCSEDRQRVSTISIYNIQSAMVSRARFPDSIMSMAFYEKTVYLADQVTQEFYQDGKENKFKDLQPVIFYIVSKNSNTRFTRYSFIIANNPTDPNAPPMITKLRDNPDYQFRRLFFFYSAYMLEVRDNQMRVVNMQMRDVFLDAVQQHNYKTFKKRSRSSAAKNRDASIALPLPASGRANSASVNALSASVSGLRRGRQSVEARSVLSHNPNSTVMPLPTRSSQHSIASRASEYSMDNSLVSPGRRRSGSMDMRSMNAQLAVGSARRGSVSGAFGNFSSIADGTALNLSQINKTFDDPMMSPIAGYQDPYSTLNATRTNLSGLSGYQDDYDADGGFADTVYDYVPDTVDFITYLPEKLQRHNYVFFDGSRDGRFFFVLAEDRRTLRIYRDFKPYKEIVLPQEFGGYYFNHISIDPRSFIVYIVLVGPGWESAFMVYSFAVDNPVSEADYYDMIQKNATLYDRGMVRKAAENPYDNHVSTQAIDAVKGGNPAVDKITASSKYYPKVGYLQEVFSYLMPPTYFSYDSSFRSCIFVYKDHINFYTVENSIKYWGFSPTYEDIFLDPSIFADARLSRMPDYLVPANWYFNPFSSDYQITDFYLTLYPRRDFDVLNLVMVVSECADAPTAVSATRGRPSRGPRDVAERTVKVMMYRDAKVAEDSRQRFPLLERLKMLRALPDQDVATPSVSEDTYDAPLFLENSQPRMVDASFGSTPVNEPKQIKYIDKEVIIYEEASSLIEDRPRVSMIDQSISDTAAPKQSAGTEAVDRSMQSSSRYARQYNLNASQLTTSYRPVPQQQKGIQIVFCDDPDMNALLTMLFFLGSAIVIGALLFK